MCACPPQDVLRVSKHGKNADATKLLAELEGKEDERADFVAASAARPKGAGAQAARRALIREDRAQRMTIEEVLACSGPSIRRRGCRRGCR